MADEPMPDVRLAWDDPDFTSHINEGYLRVTSACEEFGSMLGICGETCKQIESQVLADGEPVPLPVLKVIVGFPEQDVVRYLGNKPGGQKFIALVCALVTAFNPSECAQVLARLLECHLKREERRCPKAEQLRPLMSAINARCQLSGFAEHIVDYEIMISHGLRDRDHNAASLRRLANTPSVEAVVKLVELFALLQAGTFKDRKLKAISVYTGSCAPWIAAFVRWWFHKEPLMFSEGESSRSEKLRKGEIKVGIKLAFPPNDNSRDAMKIRGLYSEKDWKDWVFGLSQAKQYGGLVRISTYFRLMLCTFRLDRGQANEAAVEVIPFALSEARKRLTMCSEGCVSRDRWGAPCETTTDLGSTKAKLRHLQQQQSETSGVDTHKIYTDKFEPFPERPDINKILRLIDGCERKHMQDLRSKQMDMAMMIHDHPQTAAFLGQKKYESELADWMKGRFRSQFSAMAAPGATTTFHEQMAHIVATILALSLFRDPAGLLVRPDPLIWKDPELKPSTVISAICRVFRKQEACCDVTEWHRVCRKLAGDQRDKAQDEVQYWWQQQHSIISCHSGQAVWPVILFSDTLPADGESYLRLRWHRGIIYDENTRTPYRSVVGVDNRTKPDTESQSAYEIPSRLTISELSAGESRIKVLGRARDGVLHCALAKHLIDGISKTCIDPSGVFRTLASAERIGTCLHNPDVPMELPVPMDTDAGATPALPEVYLCSPDDAMPWYWDWVHRADDKDAVRRGLGPLLEWARSEARSGDRPAAVAIVPAAGNDKLRLFALAKPVGAHVAVRQRACLACCVKFCREFGFDILVL
ncbi:hypothetical protein F4776DRAFT_642309 [Hypoxylon sp. NC0597]|nr:hypothetical protein F4776DRAFT_642309 [Hypoxylon sp. NC0597]